MKKDPDELINLAMQDKHLNLLRKLRKKTVSELERKDCKFAQKMPPVQTP